MTADHTRHPDAADLAEYAEDLLEPARQLAVERHVGGCPDCSALLAELAGLPDLLAESPVPAMPAEVARRLDRAISAEAAARAARGDEPVADRGSAGGTLVPLRRRRRWLAPVVAAAAVVGAIAVAVPVLNDTGREDAATQAGRAETAGEESGGDLPQDIAAAGRVVALSSDHFARDVADAYQHAGLRVSGRIAVPSARLTVERMTGLCAEGAPRIAGGEVTQVILDGAPARLLLLPVGDTVEAIAFTCDGRRAHVLDAATLRRQ